MYFLIFSVLLVAGANMFNEILFSDPSDGYFARTSFWPFLIGFIAFSAIRFMIKHNKILSYQQNIIHLENIWYRDYGHIQEKSTTRNMLSSFGQGFGRGWMEESAKQNDFLGVAIGTVIGLVAEATHQEHRSHEQIQLENTIAQERRNLDTEESDAWFCVFGLFIVMLGSYFLA